MPRHSSNQFIDAPSQGGRLVTERKMVSDMYVFDLETFTWEKHVPLPEDDVPEPRYFHSADTCNMLSSLSNTRHPDILNRE